MLRFAEELEKILIELNIEKKEVCLLGSASLAARNLVDNNDIEFAISSKHWNRLKTFFYSKFNPLSETIKISERIECQRNSLKMFNITDDDLFSEQYSFEYAEFHIVKSDIYMAHKILSNRIKDMHIVEQYNKMGYWNQEFDTSVNYLLNQAYLNGWNKPFANRDEIWNRLINDNDYIYIFGTGSIGRHVFYRIKETDKHNHFNGFIVSRIEKKDDTSMFGKKVVTVDELTDKRCLVLIAVSIQNMVEAEKLLRNKGFKNVVQAYQFYFREDDSNVSDRIS